jgi:hypothetical protein
MHLAYSALQTINEQTNNNKPIADNQIVTRYKAYQAVCDKYSREIAAIQKYIPNWRPAFNY